MSCAARFRSARRLWKSFVPLRIMTYPFGSTVPVVAGPGAPIPAPKVSAPSKPPWQIPQRPWASTSFSLPRPRRPRLPASSSLRKTGMRLGRDSPRHDGGQCEPCASLGLSLGENGRKECFRKVLCAPWHEWHAPCTHAGCRVSPAQAMVWPLPEPSRQYHGSAC